MPGDWELGLEYPICSIDNKPCPSYFSRCDMCSDKRKREENINKEKTIMSDEVKVLNQRAIYNLQKLKSDNYVLYTNGKIMDEDVELAIKSLKNQSILDELFGQGLIILSSNGDQTDFDGYFIK